MKNLKPNPAIEAIKARLKHDLLPEGNIPNSRVAKMIELLDATATLEYAKSLNRPVRMARQSECQYTIELAKNPPRKKNEITAGLLTLKDAAIELEMKQANLNAARNFGKIAAQKIGSRYYFSKVEVERFKIERAVSKL
ncbi:hypothetical protein [Chryseobacterium arthrosphaerae]|uniref:hypothetical protein n=1 Tax=Chryseobacterium arthrosphaerae TaxID=651561 RepID=UPI0031D0141C